MRVRLYNLENPSGQLFTDEREFVKAVKDGWIDTPREIENKQYESKELRAAAAEITKKLKIEQMAKAREAKKAKQENEEE